MNEDNLNMEIRKFLKKVGVTSQREIEQAIHSAVDGGKLAGNETIKISMKLSAPDLEVDHLIEGTISLG